jgi:hypothetical protein
MALSPTAGTRGVSGQDGGVEARIELAWLATPPTFPYHLQARLVGNAVEVYGYVPSEPVRQQALRVARDESHLHVVDNLKIHASLAQPAASQSPQALSRQAMAAIKRAIPSQASHLTVSVWTNGQVLIKGTVPTLTAKLTASRCLREVSGCTCVINQLSVVKAQSAAVATMPPLTRSAVSTPGIVYLERPMAVQAGSAADPGQRGAVVSTLGQIILDEPAAVVPAVGEVALDAPTPSPLPEAQPAAPLSLPSPPSLGGEGRVTGPVAIPKAAPALEKARATEPVLAATGQIATNAATPGRLPEALLNAPWQTAPAPERANQGEPVAVPAGTTVSNHATVSPSSTWQEVKSPYTFHPTTWRRLEAAGAIPQVTSSSSPMAEGNGQIRQASAIATDSAGTGDMSRAAVGAAPEARNAQQPIPMTAVRQTAWQQPADPDHRGTSNLIILGLPEAAKRDAAGQTPKFAAAAEPASGLILLDVPQAVVLPKQDVDRGPPPNDLRQRIARACGRNVAEVEVTCPAPRTLRVGIRARNAKEAERLSNAIFQLPELDPYEVSLDIPVAR